MLFDRKALEGMSIKRARGRGGWFSVAVEPLTLRQSRGRCGSLREIAAALQTSRQTSRDRGRHLDLAVDLRRLRQTLRDCGGAADPPQPKDLHRDMRRGCARQKEVAVEPRNLRQSRLSRGAVKASAARSNCPPRLAERLRWILRSCGGAARLPQGLFLHRDFERSRGGLLQVAVDHSESRQTGRRCGGGACRGRRGRAVRTTGQGRPFREGTTLSLLTRPRIKITHAVTA